MHSLSNPLEFILASSKGTGRNGVSNERGTNFHCSNWCNIRGAGVGTLHTATIPADTKVTIPADTKVDIFACARCSEAVYT